MYKTIVRLATLDGKAVTTVQANLNFNQNYVQLKACGQSVDDVHTILFEAYFRGVPDATFHDYMRRLLDDCMSQMEEIVDAHKDITKKQRQISTYL